MLGKTFKTFEINELLGKGGMGEVYLAMQNTLDREVTLKIIHKDNSSREIIDRFIQEAKLAASTQHPNIVNIYEIGEEESFFYIAMEYIQGGSVEEKILEGTLTEIMTWKITLQVCYALQAALKNGIIHRDIKPANILLTFDNIAKVTDFGLSKNIENSSHITRKNIIVGTPDYMSPEHVDGKGVDYISDIYSLGATVYHMLTSKVMFPGESVVDVLYKHKYEKIVPPEEHKPELKYDSSLILANMLTKDPKKRYRSYSNIVSDIYALFDNSPLSFAKSSRIASLYDLGSNLFHKYENKPKTIRLTKSVFHLFSEKMTVTSQGNIQTLILIDDVSTKLKSILFETFPGKINLVGSQAELSKCLPKEAGVIINAEFLGIQVIDFIEKLRNEFPKTSIVILLDEINSIFQEEQTAPFLSYNDSVDKEMSQTIFKSLYDTPFYAEDFDIQLLIKLIQSKKWTKKILLEKNKEKRSSLSIKSGKLQKYNEVIWEEGELENVLEKTLNWTVGKSAILEFENVGNSNRVSKGTSKRREKEETTVRIEKEDYPFQIKKSEIRDEATIRLTKEDYLSQEEDSDTPILLKNDSLKEDSEKEDIQIKTADEIIKVAKQLHEEEKTEIALLYLQEVSNIYNEFDDLENQSVILDHTGDVYREKRDYKKALSFYIEAEEMYRYLGKNESLALLFNKMAMVYKMQSNYDKALNYYVESREMCYRINNQSILPASLSGIGDIYDLRKKKKEALKHYKQAKDMSILTENVRETLRQLKNIARIYQDMNRYKRIPQVYQEAIELAKDIQDEKETILCLTEVSQVYCILEEYTTALEYCMKAKELAQEFNHPDLIIQTTKTLSDIFSQMGDINASKAYNEQVKIMEEEEK